mgnify:CR=1 FL=1
MSRSCVAVELPKKQLTLGAEDAFDALMSGSVFVAFSLRLASCVWFVSLLLSWLRPETL